MYSIEHLGYTERSFTIQCIIKPCHWAVAQERPLLVRQLTIDGKADSALHLELGTYVEQMMRNEWALLNYCSQTGYIAALAAVVAATVAGTVAAVHLTDE